MSTAPSDGRSPLSLSLSERTWLRLLDTHRWFRGYRVRLVQSPAMLRVHEDLVREVYFEVGHFRAFQTPMQPLPDGSREAIWLVEYRGAPVGTLRLVRHPQALPVEWRLPVCLPGHVDRNRSAELGRFAIARFHRRRRWMVTYPLLAAAYRYSVREGIRWWVGCAPLPLLSALRHQAGNLELLKQTDGDGSHRRHHEGREGYYAAAQSVQAYVLDLHAISVPRLCSRILRQRWHQEHFWRYKKAAA